MAFLSLTNMIICHILLLSYIYNQGEDAMEFVVFKDVLFDLINECEQFDIQDILSDDTENRFCVIAADGTRIEVALRELPKET